jgi:hypothetical protein
MMSSSLGLLGRSPPTNSLGSHFSFFEELKRQIRFCFCAEALSLAKCANFFLLPFRGFSTAWFYALITEFVRAVHFMKPSAVSHGFRASCLMIS